MLMIKMSSFSSERSELKYSLNLTSRTLNSYIRARRMWGSKHLTCRIKIWWYLSYEGLPCLCAQLWLYLHFIAYFCISNSSSWGEFSSYFIKPICSYCSWLWDLAGRLEMGTFNSLFTMSQWHTHINTHRVGYSAPRVWVWQCVCPGIVFLSVFFNLDPLVRIQSIFSLYLVTNEAPILSSKRKKCFQV